LALIIFVVSEKKAFEHFPIGSNVNLCIAVSTAGLSLTLDPMEKNVSKRFFSETTWTIETKLPRNNHWKVLYKVYVFFIPIGNPIGSNVKLSPAVAAILNFISEQKT
jgi:hypothetical protein